jgi:hypothetical protein
MLLKEAFSLKRGLDFKIEYLLPTKKPRVEYLTDSSFFILDSIIPESNSELSSSIIDLESVYSQSNNFKSKFIKANLSDLEVSTQSKDVHTSLLLENSIKSTFASASSSR